MLPPHAARFLPGLGLRLGLVLGLLLGSAGLATTLLLFLATYDGTAVRVASAVTTETDITSFKLSRRLPDTANFESIAALLPTGQRYYTFADTCLRTNRSGLLQGPVAYRVTLRGPSPDQAYTTTAAGTMSVVQRSWDTVKSMFR